MKVGEHVPVFIHKPNAERLSEVGHGHIYQDKATANVLQEKGRIPLPTYIPAKYLDPKIPVQPEVFGSRSDFMTSKVAGSQGLFNFLTTTLMIAGLIGKLAYGRISANSDSRRRREATLKDVFLEDTHVFFKVLSDLDQENCIAKAVCHASSLDPPNGERNEKLLYALGISKDVPVAWEDLSNEKAKYQYAAFVGSTLKQSELEEGCKDAFPKCRLPAEDVIRMLTNEVTSCETMMNTLQSLLPQRLHQEKVAELPKPKDDRIENLLRTIASGF